jgi:hypothetical protein
LQSSNSSNKFKKLFSQSQKFNDFSQKIFPKKIIWAHNLL